MTSIYQESLVRSPEMFSSDQIRLSPSVMSPDEFAERLRVTLRSVDTAAVDVALAAGRFGAQAVTTSAAHLQAAWGTVLPPDLSVATWPGKRSRLIARRIVRKLTWWYVEPRWVVQRGIDEEVGRFATSAATELAAMRREVSMLQREVEVLRDQASVTAGARIVGQTASGIDPVSG
jgi:hypothetical protein